MKELEKYVGKCFSLNYQEKANNFKIFTIPTQHFTVDSLSDLTPARFELEIRIQKDMQAAQAEMWNSLGKL